MAALLEVKDLKTQFHTREGLVYAVNGISYEMEEGETLGIVGESGCGKSVGVLSLLRLIPEPPGKIADGQALFQGKDLLKMSPEEIRHVRGAQIAMVFQDPMTSLNPVLTIGRQLTEALELHMGMNKQQARDRAAELLGMVGIPQAGDRLNDYPHQYSGGMRQRVMIAMALSCHPRLLIADEPTTALDVTIQQQILLLLNELQRETGMAVLLITHDLNMVRHFADRVYVMQGGRVVESNDVEQLFSAPNHEYTRKLLASEPERSISVNEEKQISTRDPFLTGHDITCHFSIKSGLWQRHKEEIKAVETVDLTLRRGETLGIVGESGSGKSTLGMCLLRLQSCQGEITFDGARLDAMNPRQLRPLRRHFQVVFQDPFSSLSPRLNIGQIIGEGLALHFPEFDAEQRRARIVSVMEEVGLSESMLTRYPHEFSGGQRQRIAIARAVVLEPRLLLLDEPTSALDVSVQKQVLELLRSLQQRHGMAYIFISHDLKVIRAMAHRVMVMKHGQVVEEGETERLFEQPEHPYTKALLEAALFREMRTDKTGTV